MYNLKSLGRNNVDDIAQVEFLALCTKLVSLSLSGNPVETSPHPATAEKVSCFHMSVFISTST